MTDLFDSISLLPGVGEKRLAAFNGLGIFNVEDLLTYYPRRYEDLHVQNPTQTEDGAKVVFKGTISSIPTLRFFGAQKSVTSFGLLIDHENIKVTFFNQHWLKNNLNMGDEVMVYGTYEKARQELKGQRLLNSDIDSLKGYYPANKSINQKTIAQTIETAFAKYQDDIFNLVPMDVAARNGVEDRVKQIYDLHFPKALIDSKRARVSATFEEFFIFQMRIQLMKMADRKNMGRQIPIDQSIIDTFIKKLPYELTSAQSKVIDEIVGDLKRPIHMNRLLQGDVGSGKTVVAAVAIQGVIQAGFQAALMAPTEILAAQHAKNIADLFANAGMEIRVELLTSSTKKSIRDQILKDLANGDIDLIIGTHALIQPDVEFHNLGLAVIDEQHRFGVKQRAALRKQGQNPDILAMTATPIPRTLSITAYGEMEVSVIDQLPAGRKPIETHRASFNELPNIYRWMHKLILEGSQAYVITPLIEESEVLDAQNAQRVYEEIKTNFPDLSVALLHGRIGNDEKNQILNDFKNGKIQIVVSTTVVEVGVDAPNANIMLILDADRFGLSQLHQLRGRVGRGKKQSYAALIADPKTEYGIERLNALVQSTDGFELAQKDLELRGPGDIIGVKQSGMPEFNVGDPVKDLKIMEAAQQEAIELINTPGWDDKEENAELVRYLSETMQRYKDFD